MSERSNTTICEHGRIEYSCRFCHAKPNPAEPKGACISEGVPKCMKCSLPVANKFIEVCEACKPNPEPSARDEECPTCLKCGEKLGSRDKWYQHRYSCKPKEPSAFEFWAPYGYLFAEKHECEKAFIERAVHVIEYSAFERLQFKLHETNEQWVKAMKREEELQAALEAKEQELKSARESVTIWKDGHAEACELLRQARAELADTSSKLIKFCSKFDASELKLTTAKAELAEAKAVLNRCAKDTHVNPIKYFAVQDELTAARAELAAWPERFLAESDALRNLLTAAREREGELVGALNRLLPRITAWDGDIKMLRDVEEALAQLESESE